MRLIIMVHAVLIFSNLDAFALEEAKELKKQLKEIAKQEKQGKAPSITETLKKEMRKFILEDKDTSLFEFEKMRLLNYASHNVFNALSRKYDADPFNFHKKIKDKEDLVLYKVTLSIRKKYALRESLLCKSSEEKAEKSRHRSWLLKKQFRNKKIRKGTSEATNIYERMLKECEFDSFAIRNLLATYRYKGDKDKQSKLMLRLIEEDQVKYDYSGLLTDDIDYTFKLEYFSFLKTIKPGEANIKLDKADAKLIGEAVLTKHQAVFSLEGYDDVERTLDVVMPMVYLSSLLKHFNLDGLRGQFINKFFMIDKYDLIIRTLEVYNDIPAFQEHLVYLSDKKEKASEGSIRK